MKRKFWKSVRTRKAAVFSAAILSLGQFLLPAAAVSASALSFHAAELTAFAESREKIGRVRLTVESDLGVSDEDGSVNVTPTGDNTGRYRVEDVVVLNDDGEGFTNANLPEFEITLTAVNDSYYFDSGSTSAVKLLLDDSVKSRYDQIDVVKVSRQGDKSTLVVTARLVFDKKSDMSEAKAPGEAYWDPLTRGKAVWEKAPSAKYYQVILRKNGSQTNIMRSLYKTSYDFSQFLEEPGEYQFQVRSVNASNNAKSGWTYSDLFRLGEDGGFSIASADGGSWQKTADGRYWWKRADGTYPVSEWLKDGGKWYYFDAEGYMVTGKVTVDGVEYEMGADGALVG